MTDRYDEGYFKALVDLKRFLDNHEKVLRISTKNSRKRYETFINSLLMTILLDNNARETWMCLCPDCRVIVDHSTCAVVDITEDENKYGYVKEDA